MNPKKEKILLKSKKRFVNPGKLANISRIPPSIPSRLSKKVLEKSKFYKLKASSFTFLSSSFSSKEHSYAQVSKNNIKDNFPNLSTKKIEEAHKILNDNKKRPKINITTKGSSQRQVIVLMSTNNLESFIATLSKHVTNINGALKNIKSEVIADFI